MKIKLNIKRTLDDNLIIHDHPKLIIFISPKSNKILAIPKEECIDDEIFLAEKRMFDFFVKKGLIDPSTIKGGAVYKSMEADYFKSEKYDSLKVVLKCVYDYVTVEKEYHKKTHSSMENFEDRLLDPDDDDTTELGEIPQKDEDGSMPKYPQYSDTFWGYNL